MRSVVVVLPASMCAMIPMFRVRASGYSRIDRPLSDPPPFLTSCSVCATVICSAGVAIRRSPSHEEPAPGGRFGIPLRSPSVVRERLVRLGHLVHVLAPLDARPLAVGRVHDLGDEALRERVLAPLPRVVHEPAERERGAALRLDFDREDRKSTRLNSSHVAIS